MIKCVCKAIAISVVLDRFEYPEENYETATIKI